MSRSTANVSFYCRESKKNKDGLAPIELVIILNTRRCFIQLPRKEYPSKFKAQIAGKKRTDLIEQGLFSLADGSPGRCFLGKLADDEDGKVSIFHHPKGGMCSQ